MGCQRGKKETCTDLSSIYIFRRLFYQVITGRFCAFLQDGGLESTILFQAPVTQLKADCSIYGATVYNKNYMICASDRKFIFKL